VAAARPPVPGCNCASYCRDEHTTHKGPAKGGRYRYPARDGKFQFTVTSVTSAKSAGDSVLSQAAQGQYTVVHITVTNISNAAQTMDDSAQYVYDSQGRKFSADSTADLYANGTANSVFLNHINPATRSTD
jgi:hypothetical protein